MTKRILLYGATGYSGQLIADEARRGMDNRTLPGWSEVVLAGRDRLKLEAMSEALDLDHVVFALDDRATVDSALREFDVVINAAGPFAQTGVRLARSAIAAGCHYVDINGEADVYKRLDDLAGPAANRRVRLVSGAGFTATVSDVMLDSAINWLRVNGARNELGVVRIATTNMTHFSRGSVLTMLRSVREEVTVVRRGAYLHVPVGRLERSFDFGRVSNSIKAASDRTTKTTSEASRHRIASAANLLDTFTALVTTRRQKVLADGIESYVALPRAARLGYQLGALSAVLVNLPLVQDLTRLQIAQLPEGPDEDERQQIRQTVLLQIESPYREPWIDWRMETPNSYDLTARCALAVAAGITKDLEPQSWGWISPAHVLALDLGVRLPQTGGRVPLSDSPFQDCQIESRGV